MKNHLGTTQGVAKLNASHIGDVWIRMRITPAYSIIIEDYTSKPMVIPFIRSVKVIRLLIEAELLKYFHRLNGFS